MFKRTCGVEAFAMAGMLAVSAMMAGAADAQSFNPSGFYIGAIGGYAWGDAEHSSTVLPSPPTEEIPPDDGSYRLRGGMIGATLGYNYFHGALLLGIEGDYSGAWVDGDANCSGQHCGGELRSFATARGRIGYDMGGLLAYATGGAAFGNFKAFTDNGPGYSGDAWRTGWTIGGGLERMILPSLSAKIEYLYADFGSNDHFTIVGHTAERVELTTSVVRLGINWQLGH